MIGRMWRRRRKRSGLTTVEYALILFFFAVTSIFGFPTLAKTVGRVLCNTGDGFARASNTR